MMWAKSVLPLKTHAERLDEVLQQLEKINLGADANMAVLTKFKDFSKDLLSNLELLEKSVYTTIGHQEKNKNQHR